MKASVLKEYLKDVPDDYEVDIGTFMAVDLSEEESGDTFKVRLDMPMLGIAQNDDQKEICFVVGGKGSEELCWLLKFSEHVEKM